MAKFIGDEGCEDALREGKRRPGNHKAEWPEGAIDLLKTLAADYTRRDNVKDFEYKFSTCKMLEVEPRESAPEAYVEKQPASLSAEQI